MTDPYSLFESPFHEGELAVQQRAGVTHEAQRMSRAIGTALPNEWALYLSRQRFLFVGGVSPSGQVWASVLAGRTGFIEVESPVRVRLHSTLQAGDPLLAGLRLGWPVGMLAIDFETRQRLRMNGLLDPLEDGTLRVHLREVLANCPRYIQKRELVEVAAKGEGTRTEGERLSHQQRDWIEKSDTFLIASLHPQRGADLSHRGGRSGFVRAPSDSEILFPDYSGNNLFQTFGNLTVDSRCGLLFLDWETGGTLQVTGRAEIVWEREELDNWPGANRLARLAVARVVLRDSHLPFEARCVEPSPMDPG